MTTDIACLVSVGCGIFPGEPIGNADIIDAIKITKVKELGQKIKDTVNMLGTAVSWLYGTGLASFPASLFFFCSGGRATVKGKKRGWARYRLDCLGLQEGVWKSPRSEHAALRVGNTRSLQ